MSIILVNGLAVIAYVASCFFILRKHRRYGLFFAFFTILQSWVLISCFYNDLGVPNIELFRFTEPTYATTRLAIFGVVFNFGFLLAASLLHRRPLARIDYSITRQPLHLGHLKVVTYAAVALFIMYLTYSFATDGVPVLQGMDRLTYFQQAGSLEKTLLNYGAPLAFLLGYFRKKREKFSVNGFLMSLFLLYAILISNKFSLLVTLLLYYFLPIYARQHLENPYQPLLKLRHAMLLVLVVALFAGFSYGRYIHVMDDFGRASSLLTHRVLTLQGQMWWAVDKDVSTKGRYDRDHWKEELDNILSSGGAGKGQVGMQYLMVKVLGPEKAYQIIDNGYLYTAAYPAILIATFRYPIALIIQFFAGMVFLLLLYYLHYTIVYRHAFRAIIAVVVVSPYVVTLQSGNFDVFFTLGMAVKISVLVVLELGLVRGIKGTEVTVRGEADTAAEHVRSRGL